MSWELLSHYNTKRKEKLHIPAWHPSFLYYVQQQINLCAFFTADNTKRCATVPLHLTFKWNEHLHISDLIIKLYIFDTFLYGLCPFNVHSIGFAWNRFHLPALREITLQKKCLKTYNLSIKLGICEWSTAIVYEKFLIILLVDGFNIQHILFTIPKLTVKLP